MTPTQEKVIAVSRHLYAEMKEAETKEDYELCAEIRDYIDQLGNYVNGYLTYREIEPLLYWLIKANGVILKTESDRYVCSVWFLFLQHQWKFEVDTDEFLRLQSIEDEEVQRVINKKTK